MLRCSETGRLVNLLPSDTPSDVYLKVAELTGQLVARDAGDDGGRTLNVARRRVPVGPIAQKLEGWITKDIVKQPTMTSFYGVTAVGARRQIYGRFKEAGLEDDLLYAGSKYLAGVVEEAVSHVCVAAHRAKLWLTACARAICRTGQPVQWTTPLGLVVQQPYRNAKTFRLITVVQELFYNRLEKTSPISLHKQVNAFAPNFIHSFDATHMQMVALRCRDEGIAFAGVHDAYVTHAASMDALNVIIREEFIKLHAKPAFTALHTEMTETYPDVDLPDPPPIGDLDIECVRGSIFFFD